METTKRCEIVGRLLISSYRTYEEWKQLKWNEQDIIGYSSYRTYEEWKQSSSSVIS